MEQEVTPTMACSAEGQRAQQYEHEQMQGRHGMESQAVLSNDDHVAKRDEAQSQMGRKPSLASEDSTDSQGSQTSSNKGIAPGAFSPLASSPASSLQDGTSHAASPAQRSNTLLASPSKQRSYLSNTPTSTSVLSPLSTSVSSIIAEHRRHPGSDEAPRSPSYPFPTSTSLEGKDGAAPHSSPSLSSPYSKPSHPLSKQSGSISTTGSGRADTASSEKDERRKLSVDAAWLHTDQLLGPVQGLSASTVGNANASSGVFAAPVSTSSSRPTTAVGALGLAFERRDSIASGSSGSSPQTHGSQLGHQSQSNRNLNDHGQQRPDFPFSSPQLQARSSPHASQPSAARNESRASTNSVGSSGVEVDHGGTAPGSQGSSESGLHATALPLSSTTSITESGTTPSNSLLSSSGLAYEKPEQPSYGTSGAQVLTGADNGNGSSTVTSGTTTGYGNGSSSARGRVSIPMQSPLSPHVEPFNPSSSLSAAGHNNFQPSSFSAFATQKATPPLQGQSAAPAGYPQGPLAPATSSSSSSARALLPNISTATTGAPLSAESATFPRQQSLAASRALRSQSVTAGTTSPVSVVSAHQRAATEDRAFGGYNDDIGSAGTRHHRAGTDTAPAEGHYRFGTGGEAAVIDSGATFARDTGYLSYSQPRQLPSGISGPAYNRPHPDPGFGDHATTTARQRAWSETTGFGLNPLQQDDSALSKLSFHKNSIPEYPEYGGSSAEQLTHRYSPVAAFNRYPLPPVGPLGAPRASFSSDTPLHPLAMSRSIESFEGGRYSISGPASEASTAGLEEITTIFVVGFPEDMQEREFQNMFLFARGFEAATLKIPASTAAARERDAAAAAAVSAIAATLPSYSAPPPPGHESHYGLITPSTGGSSYDHLNNPLYEEAFQAQLAAEANQAPHTDPTQRVSHALAAAAISASASSANLANQVANRKQIIGFAKFRSREDAMEARDMLSGRKIDPEKGCVLKAEMAKKNLHTKKSVIDPQSMSDSFPPSISSRTSSSALDRLAERDWRSRMSVSGPSGAPADRDEVIALELTGQPYRDAQREPSAPAPFDQASAAYEAFHSVTDPRQSASVLHRDDRRSTPYSRESPEGPQAYLPNERTPNAPSANVSRTRGYTGSSAFGKSLLQQLNETEDSDHSLGTPAPGFGASAYAQGGDMQSRRQPPPPALPRHGSTGSMSGHGLSEDELQRLAVGSGSGYRFAQAQASHYQHSPGFSTTPTSALPNGRVIAPNGSADLVSPTYADFRISRTQNKADDNMPIATLYVGGLPSVLPSLTGPMSATALEDALRAVFSRCPGFRRLSFRQKSQGPMCFVEFDDVTQATRAMTEMYGHTLGGLVKGGIRLAYSKNPLGVRTGNSGSGPTSPTSLTSPYFASDSMYGLFGSPAASASTPTLTARLSQEAAAATFAGFTPNHQAGFNYFASSMGAMGSRPVVSPNPPSIHQMHEQHLRDKAHSQPSSLGTSSFSPFAPDRR